MTVFDANVLQAIEKGVAKQVVLADPEGFVLDNAGYVFDPDELVALFMSTQRQLQESAVRLDFAEISEFALCLVGTDLTVFCRRVFWPDGGCLVVAVVPGGTSPNLLIKDIIRVYGKFLEYQRTVLREA
jgi:hypothetical protein